MSDDEDFNNFGQMVMWLVIVGVPTWAVIGAVWWWLGR